MQRKDGLPKKHGGGRKRTVLCESCKVNPIPASQCNGCNRIHGQKYRDANKGKLNKRRSEIYYKNRERELATKAKWRRATTERWEQYLKKERIRKSQTRYGEFAEAHLEFRKLIRQLKEDEYGKDKTVSSSKTKISSDNL